MTTLCPRCEAERALRDMRAMYDWEPAPDVNVYAHAAGMAEGTLMLLRDNPLELCERHGHAGAQEHELAGLREAFHDAVTQHGQTIALLTETHNDLEELRAERDTLRAQNDQLHDVAAMLERARAEIATRKASHDSVMAIMQRILALGSPDGVCMSDDALIRLGDIRDVLKDGA